MCASTYRPRRVRDSESRSARPSTAAEPATGSRQRTATAVFGRAFHSRAFEMIEAVTSALILVGCTWWISAPSASRMPPLCTSGGYL
jgi:hypothetical protein